MAEQPLPSYLDNPASRLLIAQLGATEKLDLLPEGMWGMFAQMDPHSPHYDAQGSEQLAQRATKVLQEFCDTNAPSAAQQFTVRAITPKILFGLYKEFAKGMVDVAKHYGERSKVNQVAHFAITPNTIAKQSALGICHRLPDNGGIGIAILPRLLMAYQYEQTTHDRKRTYEDYKVPGKKFNASEWARLTGAEESVHAQQMLEGRFVEEYDVHEFNEEAYAESECEVEAAEILQEIAEAENLGLAAQDTDAPAKPQKNSKHADRAKKRKTERQNKKKNRRRR